ncbi:hypothetical protein SDC9_76182 [bioreactor metagenome]|uniref:Uncharacterized protein n=1 Tax=bioreactor metagenome TaxID=1076179 RepID=A0A644YLY8_9ZZZZ
MPRRLDRVGVEGDAQLPANRPNLGNGLDGADFVVGKHDGHKAGVRPDGLTHLVRRNHAGLRDGQ